MARRINSKSPKKIIRVFCEGESEQAYTDFIKNCFNDIAVIKYPKATGLFETAKDKFSKDPQFKDYANEIDEVWFFFDVEIKDVAKWTQRHKIIEQIRKLRKKPNIKEITARIAQNYPTAIENADKILKNLLSQGMPGLEESDERNRWLCEKCLTFSTVQEAIAFLEGERKKKS